MVTKKRVKKITSKSKKVKKKVKQVRVRATKRKINLVLKNLILFTILALGSLLLYSVSNNDLFINLFKLLAMILGFVGVAFLIVLLALLILKFMKK
jgi:polyferredoxin